MKTFSKILRSKGGSSNSPGKKSKVKENRGRYTTNSVSPSVRGLAGGRDGQSGGLTGFVPTTTATTIVSTDPTIPQPHKPGEDLLMVLTGGNVATYDSQEKQSPIEI